jgi:hypothetical protein
MLWYLNILIMIFKYLKKKTAKQCLNREFFRVFGAFLAADPGKEKGAFQHGKIAVMVYPDAGFGPPGFIDRRDFTLRK